MAVRCRENYEAKIRALIGNNYAVMCVWSFHLQRAVVFHRHEKNVLAKLRFNNYNLESARFCAE